MIVMAGSFFTELQEDEGAIHECLGQFVDIHLFPFRDKSWPVSCRIDSEGSGDPEIAHQPCMQERFI